MKLNFNKKIPILLLGIGITILSLTFVSNAQNSAVCDSVQPNGVTHEQCRFGLNFPSFNQYNDQKYLDSNNFDERNFARVRKYISNTNLPFKGFVDQLNYSQADISNGTYLQGMVYMHNSGRADCNTTNFKELADRDCKRSTFATNVRLKLSLPNGYEYISLPEFGDNDPRVISNGIIDRQNNRRIHTVNATITSSNTDPRSITNAYTVYTPIDKVLAFGIISDLKICKSFDSNDECTDDPNEPDEEILTIDAFRGNGIPVSSSYAGNITNNFLASSKYVRILHTYHLSVDAPDEEILCERLITSPTSTSAETTQTFTVTFAPNEEPFHENIRVTGINSNNIQITPNRNLLRRITSTDITLSNLKKGSEVVISSAGSPNCTTTLTFPDIPGPVCTDLNLIRNEAKGTDTQQFFTVATTPTSFLQQATQTLKGAGSLTGTAQTELVVSNFDRNTILEIQVPGQSACQAEFPFDKLTRPVCELITINIPEYDYKQNPRPEFEVTPTPEDFSDCYIWEVKDEDGNIIESKTNCNSKKFRPTDPLDGTQTVHVRPQNDDDPTCQTESTSKLPPVTEICEDIRVIRTLQRQLGRTVPTDGSPAIFTFDTGEFDGEITLQTTGNQSGTVFLTKDSRAEGEITISPDETVIILNTNETGRIRIFAQEQNQFTKDCFTELLPDPKDPGDPLTELDKSVDKAFATDGEILNYTIRYTISPIFDNPEFRDLLEEIADTAEIRDNVNQITGIQDRATNPLTSPDSRIIVTDVFLPKGLEDATGDLFGPEGLVIPNLAEKAGNTYTIKYTAILKADIIEECKVITDSCGFVFPNTAFDNFGNEDTAAVLATCPFVVSRSFGNVFLEEGFENTIDIAQCTDTKSSEGPVFTPREQKPQELIKSGGTGVFSRPTHRICQASVQNDPFEILGDELEGYRNPLENFSSSVCEVSLFTGNNWTSDDIERSMRSNVSRFQNNTNLNSTSELLSLNQESLTTFDAQNPNPKSKVYRKTNGNLTIGNGSDIIISDGTAKTIIIEGNDLIINSNITYGPNQNPLFPTQIAFIVVGGDIQVGPNVTDLSGIITAVPDENGNGGIIKRSQNTDKLLTVTGSMFGDSGPLFAGTSNPGNLTQIKGAVTVIYDGNIVLNTPPALEDIVKFSQYQTVR